MPYEDADEAVNFELEHNGPYAAIVTAGYILLNDVQEIDQLSREFHPDDGPTRKGLYAADRSQFDSWFAGMVVALGADIVRLQGLLREGGVWRKLCEANPYTATIANFHGQCFASAARDLGLSRYGAIFKAVDPAGAKEWRRRSLARWEALAVRPEAVAGRVDDAIRVVAAEKEFNLNHAYMDLIKERQRVETAMGIKSPLPSNAKGPPRHRKGSKNQRAVALLRKGESPHEIAERLKIEVKKVNQLGREHGILPKG